MNVQPPPLPDSGSALRTYLRAVAMLLPAIVVWSFANVFLIPKLQQLWRDTGLTGSKAQWLMNLSHGLSGHLSFVVAVLVAVLLLVEFGWPAWPRYRRAVITTAVVFFHAVVLIGITTIATAALIAAPLLLTRK